MKKLLFITAGIGIAAVCGTVIVGAFLSEGTVVKDPYTTALRWDSSHHERIQSGWKVTLLTKSLKSPTSELIVSVLDRTGKPLTDAAVDLHLTLPATDRYDSTYPLERTLPGTYRCVVNVPVRGIWIVHLNVRKEGRAITFDNTLYAE